MKIVPWLILVIAAIVAIHGFNEVSDATSGCFWGIIACLFGIVARIVQAEVQQMGKSIRKE